MSSITRYLPNYTVSDYQQWPGDWELLQGVAISTGPSPFGAHQVLAGAFIELFRTKLREANSHCLVIPEIDWIVDEWTVVRPDIIITCEPVPDRHVETAPLLIVEILSTATAEKDRTVKYELYQQHSVLYYLLADPIAKTVEVYRLQAGEYVRQSDSPTYEISLAGDGTFQIATAELFQ